MLLRFRLQSGDKALEEHLKSAAGNALYTFTSKAVQNELLQDILELLTTLLSQKIQASPLWALIADETTDRANRKQLVIVARYIDCSENKHKVREDHVALVDAFRHLEVMGAEVKLSGENLSRIMLHTMERLQLDKQHLIVQCYDGAAAMASEKVGVAAHVRKEPLLAH